jgi:uncharacterized Ntn-hydrolase superfamily protein
MTYSIVAYDPVARQHGVAVQTHQPAVGAVVPWVRAGVGAVATQSLTNIAFGPLGLELLASGLGAKDALAALLAGDEGRQRRQVALVDRHGEVAVHTGSGCIPHFGHKAGQHYSVQANMMMTDTVPAAMAVAYEAAQGDLMHKLMCALEAAEAEGGDIRGSQSAAILVYGSEDKPHWENRICDLRVDEHKTPVAELRRLVTMRQADLLSDKFEKLAANGDLAALQAGFAEARSLSPDSSELTFWQALLLADNHNLVAEARVLLAALFAAEPQWQELLRRLIAMGPPPDGLLDHPERWGYTIPT